ncbi:MAG: TIGR03663 family protein [Anaerolineae bacterium]|nr:TIGR03663 family protein [Anaerolineae bacterium]
MAATYTTPKTQRTDLFSRLLSRPVVLNWYFIAYVLIFVIAIVTRFAGLGDRAMSHDESLHTYYSYLLAQNGNFQHTPLMHGPILFHVTALMYSLFGANDFTSRLYPAILGVLMVMFPLLFRRWLGRTGALLASVLILISPMLLFHHRYIREDTPSIFATMIMVWCTFQYVDGLPGVRRKARWLFIFAAAMLWSLGSKEVAFMYIAIFGLFLTVFCGVRLYQHIRKRPAQTIFYHLMFPALLGGVLALIFYALISISLKDYATIESRVEYLITSLQNITTTTPTLQFSMFAGWTVVLILALIMLVVGTAIWAFRRSRTRIPWPEIALMIVLTLGITTVLIVGEEVAKMPSRSESLQADPDYDNIDTTAETMAPIIATWVICGAVAAALVFSVIRGTWKMLHRFAELDIMILMGTLALPWLTALPVYLTGASPRDTSPEGYQRMLLAFIPLMAVSILFGMIWNWKRWLISAAIFYALFAFFFTTMFTNPQGLVTGMIGSLGYWLDQQGVERGSQPQYYYQLVIMPIYEYLPMIGSFFAMIGGLTIFWGFRRDRLTAKRVRETQMAFAISESPEPGEVLEVPFEETPLVAPAIQTVEELRRAEYFGPNRLRRLPFILFTSFWAIYIFISYTLAGEKMPWLATHLTLPMILIAAWFFGRVFDRVDWQRFRQGGWIFLLLLPPLAIALFQIISPFVFNEWQPLLSGLTVVNQQNRNLWFALIAVVIFICVLIYALARRTGWRQFKSMVALSVFLGLSVMTARTAWTAAFINYDYALEYLVYAHGAPGIKLMMSQIEDISRRTAGEMNLRFAWGGNAWPVTWYFRDLTNATFFGENPTPDALRDAVAVYASQDIRSRVEPLLGDEYYRFEYMRMWWPSWNYYNLDANRMQGAWDFSPSNPNAGNIRRGLWDIWLNRDFTAYGNATGEDFSVNNWNPGERLYFYVRKDVASQIWNLGVGEGTTVTSTGQSGQNLCIDNWQPLPAQFAFGEPSSQPVPLNHPLDVDIAPDGSVFVADEFNNRIVQYDADGVLIGELNGSTSSLPLNRPNGVAFDADGDLWVADTWNYRIAEFDMETQELLTSWGQPGLFGADAQAEPTDGFWGPRDIEVGPDGNVYVSDTGNKRIRVYTQAGEWLRDIGSAGSSLGQLDEPAGIAVGTDRLYVADTWNQRISVFALDGTPLYTFDVRGWYEDQGNRPYISLDETRNLLYIGDPDSGRILVYDTQGSCIGSFGQPSDQPVDLSQLNIVGGITVSADNEIYVVDSGANRILRFPPFPGLPDVPAESNQEGSEGDALDAVIEGVSEVTIEVQPLVEETPEVTVEAVG